MYKDTHCDDIVKGDNVIIGLGDSFTQGVGAYSLETWQSIDRDQSIYNIAGQYFIDEQGNNNWVRHLAKTLNYKTFNLGINGGGNRSTIREMFLNKLPDKLGNVIVILLATGIERYDFLKQSDKTAGVNWHQKWQTIWPITSNRGPISRLEKDYLNLIWSERNDVFEFMFNINDAQNYCKSKGYKFLFCSAFDNRINKEYFIDKLGDKKEYIDLIDWHYLINLYPFESLMDMLNQLEGNRHMKMYEIIKDRKNTKLPTKYLTPCGHWSIAGQEYVANYLHDHIKKRGFV